VGGATLTGNKEVEIDGLNGAEVTSVKVNGTATAVSVAQATKAGATIDAGAASSNITIVGASTVTADSSTGNLSLTGLDSAVEDAKYV
jgi:Ethanolamine utilization protein EutJ (predicted chaperonin)